MQNKLIWLSRHEMSAEQQADLPACASGLPVVTQNVTWQATADEAADKVANRAIWRSILETSNEDKGTGVTLVAGVFPPVALEAIQGSDWGLELLTPVSAQDRKVREDGSAVIEFHHVRWSRLAYC